MEYIMSMTYNGKPIQMLELYTSKNTSEIQISVDKFAQSSDGVVCLDGKPYSLSGIIELIQKHRIINAVSYAISKVRACYVIIIPNILDIAFRKVVKIKRCQAISGTHIYAFCDTFVVVPKCNIMPLASFMSHYGSPVYARLDSGIYLYEFKASNMREYSIITAKNTMLGRDFL